MRPTNLSVLLLIIIALVTRGLFRVVDFTAGQDKEMRVPLLEGRDERENQGMEGAGVNNDIKYLGDPCVH